MCSGTGDWKKRNYTLLRKHVHPSDVACRCLHGSTARCRVCVERLDAHPGTLSGPKDRDNPGDGLPADRTIFDLFPAVTAADKMSTFEEYTRDLQSSIYDVRRERRKRQKRAYAPTRTQNALAHELLHAFADAGKRTRASRMCDRTPPARLISYRLVHADFADLCFRGSLLFLPHLPQLYDQRNQLLLFHAPVVLDIILLQDRLQLHHTQLAKVVGRFGGREYPCVCPFFQHFLVLLPLGSLLPFHLCFALICINTAKQRAQQLVRLR